MEYDSYDLQGTNFLTGTQSTDLPDNDPWSAWNTYGEGTSAQPALAEIPRSTAPISVTGILDGVFATARTGLDIFGKVAQISTSAATAKAEKEMAKAKVDLTKTQFLSAADIAKTQAKASADVARIQAENAVARESQILANTRGGTFTAASAPNLLVLVGLGVSLWAAFRKSKG